MGPKEVPSSSCLTLPPFYHIARESHAQATPHKIVPRVVWDSCSLPVWHLISRSFSWGAPAEIYFHDSTASSLLFYGQLIFGWFGGRLDVKSMQKFNVIGLANTFAVIDLILHPLFRLWIYISPTSYEYLMSLAVAGLQLEVTSFDLSISHLITGTIIEAALFWLLGAFVGLVYNKITK